MKKLSVAKFNQITAEIAEARKPKPPVVILTPEQLIEIVRQWTIGLFDNDKTIAEFYLIFQTVADERDEAKRENILLALRKFLMPFSGADTTFESIVQNRLVELKGKANDAQTKTGT